MAVDEASVSTGSRVRASQCLLWSRCFRTGGGRMWDATRGRPHSPCVSALRACAEWNAAFAGYPRFDAQITGTAAPIPMPIRGRVYPSTQVGTR